jgi:hypothetical protein
MSRGIVVFAHNNRHDYYRMAVTVAKRAERYLGLPTTIITDQNTLDTTGSESYNFDHTIVIEPDRNNFLKKATWINKGRYQVYDLTPYDDTLILDTDYMINSSALLKTFDLPTDFCCYADSKYLFEDTPNELLSPNSLSTYWATVMRFTKTTRTRELFDMIHTIQDNYEHYAELHGFLPYTYRNDYALTIALRTINGHIEQASDRIPGQLTHISNVCEVIRLDDNTYEAHYEHYIRGRKKKSRVVLHDFDFHMLNKENYIGLTL